MRRLVAVALVALLGPAAAEASLCNLEPTTLEVPVNCSLLVYNRAGTPAPAIAVERDGEPVAITPMLVGASGIDLVVDYSDDCGERGYVHDPRVEPYELLAYALPGVEVGDHLIVEGQGNRARIVDAVDPAQCRTAPEYGPWCTGDGQVDCEAAGTDDDGDDASADDGGGCNAGGRSSAWLALGLLALLARRPRIRR